MQVSLLSPDAPLQAQLQLEDLLDAQDLWQGLAKVQSSGRLGMYGDLSDKYAFVGDYPLATLPIPQATLQAKWKCSHPQLPLPR